MSRYHSRYARLVSHVVARNKRRKTEEGAFIAVNPTLYCSLQAHGEVDLGDGIKVAYRQEESGLKRELVFTTPAYTATVREMGDLLGRGGLRDQDVRHWIPPGPGRYWIGDGLALHPLEDAKASGKIWKFFCKFRIHWKRRIRGYRNRVWQCPYCLKLKIKRPPAPRYVAVVVGDKTLALEQWLLEKYFQDVLVPPGPGKPAWVEVSLSGASGRYIGNLDDAIDKLT